MSDFDPKAYLAEKRAEKDKSSDFDPKAYLAEKRAESSQNVNEELSASPESRIMSPVEAQAAGVGAGLGVEAARRGVSYAGGKTLEHLGKLSPSQIKAISDTPLDYVKARDFIGTAEGGEGLLDEFRKLSQQTREAGFNYAKQANEATRGLPDIETKKLLKAVSNIQQAPMVDVPEAELPQPRVRAENTARLETLGKQKTQLNSEINKRLESGLESTALNQELDALQKQAIQLDDEIAKTTKASLKDYKTPIQPTMAEFSKSSGIPEEILKQNPTLMTKRVQPDVSALFQDEAKFLKSGTIPAYDVAKKYVPHLQAQSSYTFTPTPTDKIKQEIARNVSQELKSMPGGEEYGRLKGLSEQAIDLEEGLAEFGLNLDSTGKVQIQSPNKIKSIYKQGNQAEISRLENLIEKAQNLGYNPESGIDAAKMSQINRFQKELPLASIKETVKNAPENWFARAAKGGAGATVGGLPGAIATNAILPTGTKMQEMGALFKGSQTGKALGKVAKFAGPLAGLAVTGLSYKDARSKGLDVSESIGTTVGEVLNPIPLTDVTGAYIAGKKEFQKNPWDEALIPTAKAASTAFVKPIAEAYEEGKKGTQAVSKANISDYKQQFRTPDYTFKSTDTGNMQNLSDRLAEFRDNKAAQGWSQELTEASEQSDSQKEATLYRLNQLKEFRALVRKTKGIKE
jgi:uncharacterized protein YdcH (DUF465 family)